MAGITPTAAKDLGRQYRFVRQAHELTLRDAAKASGVSFSYVVNIEMGTRTNVSEEAYRKYGLSLQIPSPTIENMLLQARIMSALELRGLDSASRRVVWGAVADRLRELDIDVRAGFRSMIEELVG